MSAALHLLVRASRELTDTPGRNDKVATIAAALAQAGEDAGLAATYLTGDPPQDRMEVGWATLTGLDVSPAATPSLTLVQVDRALTGLSAAGGAGSRASRQSILRELYGQATHEEQDFLSHLLVGEMRHGALAGLVLKGVAKAADVPELLVRRALMLSADLAFVTGTALREGREGLATVGLTVGRGIQPMLATTAESVTQAMTDMTGPVVVEWKLDGARIQVHKDGDDVWVFTRNLNDITARSKTVVDITRALPAHSLILDGEVLALGPDERPWAFQDTISAFAADTGGHEGSLTPFFFDLLHVDSLDLIDLPLMQRRQRLRDLVPPRHLIPEQVASDPQVGEDVLAQALDRGHEGVMIKSPDSPYAAGRRGKTWRKVKPVRTLDLVVLAAEWGSGRRKGWLSNIHLGARDGDDFVMLGKTFKGMTDKMLAWQTGRFLDLQTHREGHVVYVRPAQVVEIALDGIQVSRRYPGGVALRFARVLRYRDDKDPAQVDTLDTVRALGSST